MLRSLFHLYLSPYLDESGGDADSITPHFDWNFILKFAFKRILSIEKMSLLIFQSMSIDPQTRLANKQWVRSRELRP